MTAQWTTLTDLRYGARAMARNPGFTAIAVLTMALGIGATATIFSVVRSVLLRPLPFPEPDRIVQLWETRPARDMYQISFTYANFWDVRDMNRTLDAVGAIRWSSMNVTSAQEPMSVNVASVTEGFFRALRVTPVVGRLLHGHTRVRGGISFFQVPVLNRDAGRDARRGDSFLTVVQRLDPLKR